MARARKPASLKQGKSETKAQLQLREEMERRLMGGTDRVKEIPDHLDPLAQLYYKFLVTEMEISGLLSNLDIPFVEQVANCLSKLRECDEQIDAHGVCINKMNNRTGQMELVENPYLKAKKMYLDEFRAMSNKLGLDPGSRASLAGMKVEEQTKQDDPLLQVLSKFER